MSDEIIDVNAEQIPDVPQESKTDDGQNIPDPTVVEPGLSPEGASSIEERKGWIAPLGILITILVVLLTANFKDIIWSPDTWAALFVLSAGLSFLWLIKSLWKAYQSETIDNLIEKIKKQE